METDRLTSEPPDDTVHFSIRELAELLGVTVSAVSHAVQKSHHLKGLYPVTLWAVRDERGRVVGFDVPAEAADVIAPPPPRAQRPLNDASTGVLLSAQPPVTQAFAPRGEADYERQSRHYEGLLERARLESDTLRDDLRRALASLDDERAARRRDVDEVRERLAEQREAWSEERQTFRDEVAEMRARLLTWESGGSPEDTPEPSFWGQLLSENASVLAPLVQTLTARLMDSPPNGSPATAPSASAPEANGPASPAPSPQAPAEQDHIATLTRYVDGVVQGMLDGNIGVVTQMANLVRSYPAKLDWPSTVQYGLSLLRENDPEGKTARHLRSVLNAVYPQALSLDVGTIQALLAPQVADETLRAWASDFLEQGLTPASDTSNRRRKTGSSTSKLIP